MEVQAKAFKVTQCGYYVRGEKEIAQFGSLDTLANLLGNWTVEDRPIQETMTFDVGAYDELLPVYFMGVHTIPRTNESILRLWNQTDVAGDQFGSLIRNSTVHDPDVRASDIPPDGVPGFPSYYWIIPDHDIVVGLRFRTNTHGHPGFNTYIRCFLSQFSEHVVKDTDGEVLGYIEEEGDEPVHMYPRFHSIPHRLPAVLDQVRRHCPNIRRLLQRKSLTLTMQRDRNLMARVLKWTGMDDPDLPNEEISFEYETDFQPSSDELEEILDNYQTLGHTPWDDIGFRIKGKNQPLWLGARQQTITTDLSVTMHAGGLIELSQLGRELRENRTRLVRQLGI